MSKSQDAKKTARKKPLMTLMEKRHAKEAKRAKKISSYGGQSV
jgi:hypothetical protein